MDTDLSPCPVCHEPYDLSEHLPKVLPSCGHTICQSCLKNIVNIKSECPLDKTKIEQSNSIPVNIIVKQLIETRGVPHRFCQKHPTEKLSFLCLSEKTRLCDICLEENQEKGHTFKSFSTIRALGATYKEKIKDIIDELGNYREKTDNILSNNRSILENTIKQQCQEMKDLIEMKETELIIQLDTFLFLEKKKIENLLGTNCKIIKDFSDKSSAMTNITERDEYLMNLESLSTIDQEINDWKSTLSSNSVHQKIEDELCNLKKSLEDFFMQQQDYLKKIVFSTSSNPLKSLTEMFSLGDNIEDNFQDSQTELISSRFKFTFKDYCLEISYQEKPQDQIVTIKELSKVRNIELCLTKSSPWNTLEIKPEDVGTLIYLLKKVKELSELRLKFSDGTVNSNFNKLIKAIPGTISGLRIEVIGQKIDQNSPLVGFLEGLVAKSKNLKKLKLLMSKVIIPDGTFTKIFNKDTFNPLNLEEVHFDLKLTDITDNDLACILLPMPNLRFICLLLEDTKYEENKCVQVYSKKGNLITKKKTEICAKKTVTNKSIEPFINFIRTKGLWQSSRIELSCEGVSLFLKYDNGLDSQPLLFCWS